MKKFKTALASNNEGKLNELKSLLEGLPLDLICQKKLKISEIAETGLTFIENAISKARNACLHAKLPAIADDSGLEVDALRGRPGIYTARFAGHKATAQENINKMLAELRGLPLNKRTARFCCALVYMRYPEDPTPIVSQAFWDGIILAEPKGKNGFGYDPIFYIPDKKVTAAQLPPEVKRKISHRGRALQGLVEQLKEFYL